MHYNVEIPSLVSHFTAGVPTSEFARFASPYGAGRQRQDQWCWAAVIEKVLQHHGLYVEQEQIVERIYGRLINAPGTARHMLMALSGRAPDFRGRTSSIHASICIPSVATIVEDLDQQRPLIVVLKSGHAYVLMAVRYSVWAYRFTILDQVVLHDPSPCNTSRQEISGTDFVHQVDFFLRVYVLRH